MFGKFRNRKKLQKAIEAVAWTYRTYGAGGMPPGYPGDGKNCPVANGLTQIMGKDNGRITVGPYSVTFRFRDTISAWDEVHAKVPEDLTDFIMKFDQGKFPGLIKKLGFTSHEHS